ncbi:MAG: TIGR04282 family arsenosugar biosynthesis glycosyltransferase [Pirellulaceae bacterium]
MNDLGIFAKYWEPGRVKTRLAATLGTEAASQLYRQFVATLVRRFARAADRRILCFAPPDRAEPFAALAGTNWIAKPQATGDLGARMASFFDACFQDGAERVVLIGSDSPTLPMENVEAAFRLLHETDVVLGPTDDGGYYLVGASRNVPGIFAGIAWSTPLVWEQTVARIGQLQLSYESLPQWYDVDELPDLERLRDELSRLPHADAVWSELLDAVHRIP